MMMMITAEQRDVAFLAAHFTLLGEDFVNYNTRGLVSVCLLVCVCVFYL